MLKWKTIFYTRSKEVNEYEREVTETLTGLLSEGSIIRKRRVC